MTGTAVAASGWVAHATVGGRRVPTPLGGGAVEIAESAASIGCDVVYVLLPPEGFLAEGPGVTVTGGREGEAWRVAVEVEGAGRVQLVSAAAAEAGPWQGMSAGELVAAFVAFERLVGVPWGESVGRTAERLILATHPRERGGTRLDLAPECPEPAAAANLELAWQSWRREPTEEEQSARWVHAFDANAQYLAAWQAVELGHGTPTHLVGPKPIAFAPRAFGLWRLESLPANHRPELPAPWIEGREWFTTATVERMAEFCEGWEPEPVEAWIWPRRSRFLRATAERLRDARQSAQEELRRARAAIWGDDPESPEGDLRRIVAADAVLDAVKAIYRVQTGRFNMAGREGAWSRPEWGHAIRATARVNLHRRLCRLGQAPFAIATDGLLFATDEPDAHKFAERIGLPVSTGLGQFSYEGTAPAEPIWDAYQGGRRGGAAALFRAVADNRIEED